MKEELVDEALRYASSSNMIEDLNVTKDELEYIKREILKGNSNKSYLYSVVENVMKANGELLKGGDDSGKVK